MSFDLNKETKKVKFIDSTEEIMKNLNRDRIVKRARLKLSYDQICVLESNFRADTHPSHLTKTFLANKLNIPLKNVQIWFQNRRAKEKIFKDEMSMSEARDNACVEYKMSHQSMCPFDLPGQGKYFY
jgi:hypothetical protein